MRVLVTGGLGVIGHRVARLLSGRGHEILATDRRDDGLDRSKIAEASFNQLDVRDAEAVSRAVARFQPDCIAHTAADVNTDRLQADPRHGVMTNLVGTVNVLEAARAQGVGRFVFTSSRAVYGPIDEDTVSQAAAEEDCLKPRYVYDVCKAAAELLGRNYHRDSGVDFVALRFATIYGPGKSARHTHASLFSRIIEEAVGLGSVVVPGGEHDEFDLIYVEDAARAVAACVEAPRLSSLAYNVSSGVATPLRTFVDHVAAEVPGSRLEFAADEHAVRVRYRLPLTPKRIEEELGFRPVYGLADGVRDYVETVRRTSL